MEGPKVFKIKVQIAIAHHSFIVDVYDEVKKEFDALTKKNEMIMSWEEWVAPLNLTLPQLKHYKGNHFIYSWLENYLKSDKVPLWMYEEDIIIQTFAWQR
jgi:hypothetical protein